MTQGQLSGQMQGWSPQQQEQFRRRMAVVVVGLLIASMVVLVRLASFQRPLDPEANAYLQNLRDAGYQQTLQLGSARGSIYDRNGEPLAVNMLEYSVGISPNLVNEPQVVARQLSAELGLNELSTFNALSTDLPWVGLADEVSAEVGQRLRALDIFGLTMEARPRRSYPQGTLAAHVVGFVGANGVGYFGVEGYYNDQLSGEVRERQVSNIPFELPLVDWQPDRGADIVLTIDRDVQYIVETELAAAIDRYNATAGTIIVMNPRSGDILGMANWPTFDPNVYTVGVDEWRNPAISEQFEPGSIFKVVTVAAALETGAITPDWTYNDQGVLEMGGITIRNWDRAVYGTVDTTQVLVQSLNVGVATISTLMGPTDFYRMLDAFGVGSQTNVDMEGEAAGTMFVPGDADWSESMLGTNAFGQGVAVTPLQMLTAVSAIANDGRMMRPNIVHQTINGDRVTLIPPSGQRLISETTARQVRDMMVAVVRDGVDGRASVDGYTIAGKTGTAQIPTPLGYDPNDAIASFVGFLPADDPQLSILVKLDRPNEYWGARTAAPTFQRLAERLVIALEIPTDAVRAQLAQAGGSVDNIRR
ncbi:MAG: penicillin-binding protein 2 [Chloroflexi bacterium]|nr:penicillin-binding protein 2 [Chloroflexota bacterium]